MEGIVYSVFGMGFGGFLFINGIRWMKRKRLIENIPTSKIRSLAMGLVEIFGEALPAEGKILKSPLSTKDCVYYRYTIEEHRQEGKHSRWVTINKGTSNEKFYLKDNTGHVLVDPIGAKIDIPMDFEYNSGWNNDPPRTVKEFLKRNNMSFEGFLGLNRQMRYREYIIEPKDKIYIMGTAGDNPHVEDATATEGVKDVMIQKGRHEKFYYISDKPEKELLGKLRWKVLGGLGFGTIVIAGSFFFFILSLGFL